MPTKTVALKIVNGQIERIEDARPNDLQWLHEQVGGYIEVALTNGYAGQERVVVICNEEGHLLGLPINVIRGTDGWPLVGNLIVLGCSAEDFRGLRPREEDVVAIVRKGDGPPILTIRR